MYHGEVRNVGLWRRLQREIGGLHRGCILARYNPGALAERFASGLAAVNRPWAATKRVEDTRYILKMMVSGAAKTLKWWCSGVDFSVICENDMLWSGNLGLKMGVSNIETWHIPNMHIIIWKCPPPPPGSCHCQAMWCQAIRGRNMRCMHMLKLFAPKILDPPLLYLPVTCTFINPTLLSTPCSQNASMGISITMNKYLYNVYS